jgi:predicted DNA-binding protein (UPF0278 family)
MEGGNGHDSEGREAVTIDGATGKPEGVPKREKYNSKLATVPGVAEELRKLYRAVRRGALDSSEGYKRAMILRELREAMVDEEIINLKEQLENGSSSKLLQ